MTRGFTLIEILVYLGLFSILLFGIFSTAYEIMQNSNRLNTLDAHTMEYDFLTKKIEWALGNLTGADLIISPSKTSYVATTTLSLEKTYQGEKISVEIIWDEKNNEIMMKIGDTPVVPITTSDTTITKLDFTYIPETATMPPAIKVEIIMGNASSTLIRYIL